MQQTIVVASPYCTSVRAFTSTSLALSRCLISRVYVDVHKQLVISITVVYRRTSSPVIAPESIPTDHSLDLRCCRQLDLQWPLPSVPADCRSPSSCLTRCNSSPKLSISVCSRVSAYVGTTVPVTHNRHMGYPFGPNLRACL